MDLRRGGHNSQPEQTGEAVKTHGQKMNGSAQACKGSREGRWLAECCFTSIETIRLIGTGAQHGHLDFHTARESKGDSRFQGLIELFAPVGLESKVTFTQLHYL